MNYYKSRHLFIMKLGLLLVIVKVLYIVAVSLMLSEDWHNWDYYKDINYSLILYELIPFFIGLLIFLRTFRLNGVGFFTTMFFIMSFVPANSGLSVSNANWLFFILNHIYLLIFLYLLGKYSIRVGDIKEELSKGFIENFRENRKITWWFRCIMIALTLLTLYRIYLYNGLNLQNILIGEMYDVRADTTEFYASQEGSFYAYLYIITSGVLFWFIPIYLYSALVRKNLFDIGMSIFAIFAEFSASMMKSTLFAFLIIFFVYFLYKKKKTLRASEYFLYGIILLFLLSIFEYSASGLSLIFNTIINRMFYMTQYMITCHYEFFSVHPKFWFSQECLVLQNIISSLFGSPYNAGAIKLISDNCFSGLIPAPNAGLFAEAYAQMGIIGAFVFPFIHMYLVKLVFKSASWYGQGVVMIIMAKCYLRLGSVYNLETGYLVPLLMFVFITFLLKKIKIDKPESSNIYKKDYYSSTVKDCS